MSSNPPKQSDADIERKEQELDKQSKEIEASAQKTQFINTSTDKTGVVGTGEYNILNDYRSVTYNFTLAGLPKDYLKDPSKYREGELELVILKSGGKSFKGITPPSKVNDSQAATVQSSLANDPTVAAGVQENNVKNVEKLQADNSELVDTFNRESPGRFDMFIENLDIESFMAASEEGNTAKPTKMTFDVIEPFSINGFIEALHVTAIAAGYTTYMNTPFVLKIEFIGYPDDVDLPEPEVIPNSTRYFPIVITKMAVEVTERGTKYRCSALPVNDRAFGHPNQLYKPIKMEGSTVKEILNDFMQKLTKQAASISPDANPQNISTNNFENTNEYEIKFPSRVEGQGFQDTPENEIASSPLTAINKDSILAKMIQPEQNNKANAYKSNANKDEKIQYKPGETVVQFNEGASVDSIIAAVIRDSTYGRDLIKQIEQKVDDFGMLDYFAVNIQVENLDKISLITKEPYKKYTYVVTPYKVHISRIQPFASLPFKEKKLKKLSRREYNYLYTGQNIDVINFKLEFNYLFFEAVPPAMGNKDIPAGKGTSVRNGSAAVQVQGTSVNDQKEHEVPLPPTRTSTVDVQSSGGNALQPRNDPYSNMAKAMHESIINSKSALLKGELDILGDPFYLVTGGMGNFNPKLKNVGETENGEAAYQYQEVLVTINFRNPVDINTDTGMMEFDDNRIPFSGVYRVIKVKHSFKEGVFKQRLEVMRFNGQVLDQKVNPKDPNDMLINKANPSANPVPDTSLAENTSIRVSSESVSEQLGRGLPDAGEPGEPIDFTGNPGGLGGGEPNLLVQTPGQAPTSLVMNAINNPTSIIPTAVPIVSQIIGQPLPSSDLASNIRLKTSGLFDLNKSDLGSAALVAAAANIVTGNLTLKKAAGVLAGGVIGSAIANSISKTNLNSGIGEGATNKLVGDFIPSSEVTSAEAKQGQDISNFINPSSIISDVVSNVKNLGSNAIDNVVGLGANAGRLVSGIGEKLQGLTAPSTDPLNVVARGGLDSQKLAGISNFTSKINDQVTSLMKNTPDNVDLEKAALQGIILDYLPTSKILNLPPIPPYATAPEAGQSLIDEAMVSANMSTPIERSISLDKIATAKVALSQLSGLPNVVDQNTLGSVVDKFGSSTKGLNPLDKLIRKTET